MTNRVWLNIVIYNEPISIIKRCLDTVHSVIDGMVILAHHTYPTSFLDILENQYSLPTIRFTDDLDNSVVEEWRNMMIEETPADWILVLDPDEYLDKQAQAVVNEVRMNIGMFSERQNVAGICLARRNFERTEDGGYIELVNYPDYQFRLFKRGRAKWSGRVHEPPTIPEGDIMVIYLGHIIHDKHYESMEQWHRKADLYRRKAKW